MLMNQRAPEFRRSEKLEQLLHEVNELLSTCQEAVNKTYQKPKYPLLLIMGAPRSGTTLFLQWLAESHVWGYPSNLISRFYKAPYLGARIQQILIDYDFRNEISDFNKNETFVSSLGKTHGAIAPNEFWYFWRRFFTEGEDSDVMPAEALAQVDVASLNRELAAFEAALEKPLAMKGNLMDYYIPFLDKAFEKVIFVHVRRNPAYVVQSMLESRRKFYGTEELWYSLRPPEYERLRKLSPVSQIAGQIHALRRVVDEALTHVDPARKLVVDYEAFCENPETTWHALRERMMAQGCDFPQEYTGQPKFEMGNQMRVSPERWAEIQKSLGDLSLLA